MFYTIYKITNVINDKFYIGMHKTNNLDDGYMGSGKRIRYAINKYGIENFTKDILHIFDNEEDMRNKEKELVVLNEMSYNLCEGGHGGWGYINRNGINNNKNQCGLGGQKAAEKYPNGTFGGKKHTEQVRQKIAASKKGNTYFLGKKHTEDTKRKMKKPKNQGINNSQFNTCWITNGSDNRKISKTDPLPEGWYRGRRIGVHV